MYIDSFFLIILGIFYIISRTFTKWEVQGLKKERDEYKRCYEETLTLLKEERLR